MNDQITDICQKYGKMKTELADPQSELRTDVEHLGFSAEEFGAEAKAAAEAAIKSVIREKYVG